MDPVTHAASGAVALLALPRRPATLWSLPLAALACASPDIDLCFIHTPLEFLQLHRGITHSFAGSLPLGFLLALICYPLWRKSTPDRWSFPLVWLFCVAVIWLHMWLDIVTTYGTMIFLPFSAYRVRLNAIFMIDLLITVPMLWAIWKWRARSKLMLATLVWIFLYPSIGIAANIWHTQQWRTKLAADPLADGQMVVLPDALSPLFWRVLYTADSPDGPVIMDQPANALGQPRGEVSSAPAAPARLTRLISEDSIAGDTYFKFALLPVVADLRKEDEPAPPVPDSRLCMFYDLRFGSGLKFVQEILAMRPNADMPFQLLAELVPAASDAAGEPAAAQELEVDRIRLRFKDSGRDSGWHRPHPPGGQTFWQWLVGIE